MYVIVPASNAYQIVSQWQEPYCSIPQHKQNILLILKNSNSNISFNLITLPLINTDLW